MMSIKRKRKRSNNYSSSPLPPIIISKTLRQEIKELIDIIGHREDQLYRDGCLEDICKVLEKHLDIKINHWIQSFNHHEQKEKEWLDKGDLLGDFVFKDIHNSMKIYSNGAAHGLQFFKDELKKSDY